MEHLESFVPTKGSLKKKIDFQCVSFESYKSKKSKEDKSASIEKLQISSNHSTDINIKKAKHDVIKFGMSGFDPQKKEEVEVQLAIKLGAKPPKNKYKNYKVLQLERKKEKEKESSRLNFQQLGKNSIGRSTAKGKSFDRKRKKENSGILNVYGKVKSKQL